MEPLRVVGQAVARKDAIDIVTGNVRYGVDVTLPGMLRGKVVRSDIPTGSVRLDVARARSLTGVAAVITAADVPTGRFGYAVKDELIFARDNIRYAGEAMAAIAAVDEDTAEEAAKLIEVDYAAGPGVFDVLEAIKEDAPLVHEDMGGYERNQLLSRRWYPVPETNILHQIEFTSGSVTEGFNNADAVFEDTFRTRRVHQCYLEPHGCVAKVDAGKITVWTSTQRPFVVRSMLADIFSVPENDVRVICTKVGGGFGGKNGVRLEHYAVALAMKTGRPVKLVMPRDEEFTASAGSVPAVIVMKTGVKEDGTLTARQARFIWDCGAYSDALPTSNRAIKDATGPYRIPHIQITSTLVYTNTMRGCPFRGLGGPEWIWAGESQMDMIAHRMGFDPVEFRLKNLFVDGDHAPTGELLESVRAKECLLSLADEMKNTATSVSGQGTGISMVYKSPTGAGGVSTAALTLARDGGIRLLVGSADVGGGMETVLSQIAAEELGADITAIDVVSGDTATIPFDHGTYSSRATVSSGLAVRRAAVQARTELLKLAGEILATDPDSLRLSHQRILSSGSAEAVPVEAIFKHPRCPKDSITAIGTVTEDGDKTGWRFGAQGVHVQVDKDTGVVQVLRVVSVHDVGKAVNPPLVTGQVEGGIVMGLGCALGEELRSDEGRIINPTFADYGIPFAADIPPIHSIIIESPLPVGPFGAKGIGEIGDFGIAPAIANAIQNAVGIRLTELPLRPENVLDKLES